MLKKYTVLNFKSVFTVALFQFMLLLILFFLVYFYFDYSVALSGVYGGVTSIVSSLLFFVLFFFHNGNHSPRFIVIKKSQNLSSYPKQIF